MLAITFVWAHTEITREIMQSFELNDNDALM